MTFVWAGLLAGFVHVLSGPDHVAAIAPYAVAGKARAWRTGARWGLGHGAGVLLVGVGALLLRSALPVDTVAAWSESGVGFVLCAVGLWGLRAAARGDRAPRRREAHVHGRVALAVGTLHGLAGSSHVLGIVPALALPSTAMAGAYLFAFVGGGVVAMAVFAALLGALAARPVVSGVATQRALLALSSAAAVAIGMFWILG